MCCGMQMELSRELKLPDEEQDGCGENKLSWWLSQSENWLYVFCVGKESVRKVLNRVVEKFGNPKITTKIVSEYDQEIPQSQTADNPIAPQGKARGRATQPS